jgi:hypothetical protein
MWSIVLLSALMTGLNPIRIGLVLLMVSRPRPLRNLFVYWIGSLIVSTPPVLGALLIFRSAAGDVATSGSNPTMRHVQLGIGLLALTIAAWLVVRPHIRSRPEPVLVGVPGEVSTDVEHSVQDGTTRPDLAVDPDARVSLLRRLQNRVRRIWDSDSLWVPLLMGLGTGPPADGMVIVVTAILAAGLGLGTQILAGTIYVLGTLLAVEVVLMSYVFAPSRTQSTVQRLHDWTRTRFRQIMVGILVLLGAFSVAASLGWLG